MIDINSPTFIEDFRIEEATVGAIGYGFIGNAVVELFRPHVGTVLVYDKQKCADITAGATRAVHFDSNAQQNVFLYGWIEGVVASSEVIFVAVPTPMKPSGECHTGIVESVLQDIQNVAIRIGRSLDDFVVVLKSTVPPGFTRQMQDKYALRLVFSPEFLTEAHAVRDFKTTNRVLLGGDIEDARVVFKYFEGVWPDRQPETWQNHPDGPVAIVHCTSEEAELAKLSTNVHLTARVMVSNEIYLICQRLGINYEAVKLLTQLDRRIGRSHMDVPGPDGHLGYGGHCFVKDTQSLGFISEQAGCSSISSCGCDATSCVAGSESIFRSLHARNLKIRKDRDWESQRGRAVTDD